MLFEFLAGAAYPGNVPHIPRSFKNFPYPYPYNPLNYRRGLNYISAALTDH